MTDYDNTPLTLEQARATFDMHDGVPVASAGEGGDHVLLGHWTDEQALAAVATSYGCDVEDVAGATITRGWAQLTPHLEGCEDERDMWNESEAEAAEEEGTEPRPFECTCRDEYAWCYSSVRTDVAAATAPLAGELAVTEVRY